MTEKEARKELAAHGFFAHSGVIVESRELANEVLGNAEYPYWITTDNGITPIGCTDFDDIVDELPDDFFDEVELDEDHTIEGLSQIWLETKEEEKALAEKRKEIEEKLYTMIDHKEDGSLTTKANGYKITITTKLYRKIDAEIWAEVADRLEEEARPVKTKLEVDTKKLNALSPEKWGEIAEAFTTTPGKPGFKIEKID